MAKKMAKDGAIVTRPLKEGVLQKGGVNPPPTSAKPSVKPGPQKPPKPSHDSKK